MYEAMVLMGTFLAMGSKRPSRSPASETLAFERPSSKRESVRMWMRTASPACDLTYGSGDPGRTEVVSSRLPVASALR